MLPTNVRSVFGGVTLCPQERSQQRYSKAELCNGFVQGSCRFGADCRCDSQGGPWAGRGVSQHAQPQPVCAFMRIFNGRGWPWRAIA